MYFSLLKLIKYDPKEGIIHHGSFILKYITPNNATHRKHPKLTHTRVVKRSTMEGLIMKEKALKVLPLQFAFIMSDKNPR